MSNSAWVCFDCRRAERRSAWSPGKVSCSECGKPCVCLGHKIPVPPRSQVRRWQELREQLCARISEQRQVNVMAAVRRKHELEQEIARLEAMPPNAGRARAVELLRKKLKAALERTMR